MRPLVFLDIDGVLNGHHFNEKAKSNLIDRDKVEILNHILEETDAEVVLSSAWRYLVHNGAMSLYGLDHLLRSHGMLEGRLIGVTRKDTMEDGHCGKEWPVENERGKQISDWLLLYTPASLPTPYVVIDDMDLGISAEGHPFVKTLGSHGLTWNDAAEAIRLLKQR